MQKLEKCRKRKTKLYKKTWEETWKQLEKQHGVDEGNDGEDLTKAERKTGD